jgi:hypothetical protein
MKAFPKFVVIGLLIVSAVVSQLITHALTVYPTEQTKSAFLKDYSPAQVVDCFKVTHGGQRFGSAESAAGRRSATHHKEIRQLFVIRAEDLSALTTTLRRDIVSKLTGQTVPLGEMGNAAEGYQFKYEAGNTLRTVSLKPVEIVDAKSVTGPKGLRPGQIAVSVHVVIVENWVPSRGQ